MKALVLESFGGPLVEKDVPIPEPADGEVLVRVQACAADQFDLTVRDGKFPTAEVPLILGHEIAGIVEKTGPGVSNYRPGSRVTSTLYLTCGRCRHCRSGRETICENFIGYLGIHTPGGYAQYTTIPAVNLAAIPDDLAYAEASILANAIGTPYHALTKRARLRPGEHVLITGAAGGVGLHAVQLARMMGAMVMAVDIGAEKLEAARANGADVMADAEEVDFAEAALEWTEGRGVDVVLELVGPATMPGSLKAMGKGARMVIVGSHTGAELCVRPQAMISNEWEIVGSRNVTKRELQEVVELVAAGRVKPIVTEVRPLADAETVHARLRERKIIGRVALVP